MGLYLNQHRSSGSSTVGLNIHGKLTYIRKWYPHMTFQSLETEPVDDLHVPSDTYVHSLTPGGHTFGVVTHAQCLNHHCLIIQQLYMYYVFDKKNKPPLRPLLAGPGGPPEVSYL